MHYNRSDIIKETFLLIQINCCGACETKINFVKSMNIDKPVSYDASHNIKQF